MWLEVQHPMFHGPKRIADRGEQPSYKPFRPSTDQVLGLFIQLTAGAGEPAGVEKNGVVMEARRGQRAVVMRCGGVVQGGRLRSK
jgi:hypothetical protein